MLFFVAEEGLWPLKFTRFETVQFLYVGLVEDKLLSKNPCTGHNLKILIQEVTFLTAINRTFI